MEQTRIGEIVWIQTSPRAIRVRAVVDHTAAGDYAWSPTERGETLCFSVATKPGTTKLQGLVDGVRFFSEWELKEVSVCRQGANPDCKFHILKGALEKWRIEVFADTTFTAGMAFARIGCASIRSARWARADAEGG
jgi:hypothetical protein